MAYHGAAPGRQVCAESTPGSNRSSAIWISSIDFRAVRWERVPTPMTVRGRQTIRGGILASPYQTIAAVISANHSVDTDGHVRYLPTRTIGAMSLAGLVVSFRSKKADTALKRRKLGIVVLWDIDTQFLL